jgi:hydroxypyruvate isomerase|tara:strand:+ start:1184 stop:1969 length:786 start_codon:yes stop_codon:yes gene_type:complete
MNKLAANLSMLFTEEEFLKRFKLASDNGFLGVEYLFPYEYKKEDIKNELDSNNLKQILFDFPAGDFSKGDRGIAIFPDRKSEFQEGVHKALEYAEYLDCNRLTVLVGIDNGKFSKTELHDTLIENLSYAAEKIKNKNINILVEALNTIDAPNYFVSNTEYCKKIIKEIDLDYVKIQYDIYHMQIMEGDILRTFENNKDLIGHIQIADNPGRNEPGTGELNYKKIFSYLSKNYDGWIGCEYSPKQSTLEGLSWINKNGAIDA